jgi:anti-sigma B factor antagonist
MALNQIDEGGVVILAVDGNLDGEGTQTLEEKVLGLLENGTTKLLFDFSGLDYLNSSGIWPGRMSPVSPP